MVELQPCASLVNASALCVIEQEAKGESTVNVIAQISAELQRERENNAELRERISILEAQIKERDKESFLTNGQVYMITHVIFVFSFTVYWLFLFWLLVILSSSMVA